MVEVFDIIAAYGVNCHCYSDDMQVYASVSATMAVWLMPSHVVWRTALSQLDQWMSKNMLKLNADKTQLIWPVTRQQLAKLTVTQLRLTSSVVEFDSTVTDLGVVLDNQLSMQAQVAAVCRSCLYQLRQLRVVQRSLTRDVLQFLV